MSDKPDTTWYLKDGTRVENDTAGPVSGRFYRYIEDGKLGSIEIDGEIPASVLDNLLFRFRCVFSHGVEVGKETARRELRAALGLETSRSGDGLK